MERERENDGAVCQAREGVGTRSMVVIRSLLWYSILGHRSTTLMHKQPVLGSRSTDL